MPISMPDCDVIKRLPEGATNAVCVRCARHLAGGSGPRQWIYCDRRERRPSLPDPNSYVPIGARLANPQAQATADLIEGLGRYSIGEELGRGGMGMVVAAHDTVLDRQVALKVQISGKGASPIARRRFAQELQTLATLQVDGIARVLDGGVTVDGMAWYVMEKVEGPTLADVLLDAFALPRNEALRIVRDLARTMARVHGKGIAHRDIKPNNILLTLDGRPILVDFGLVTSLQRDEDTDRLTVDIVGTPQYMAPEQNSASWDEIDWVRVDVYALGMVLIESLTGALPPTANPTLELLPASVRQVCERATHPDPRHRYATPALLADALDAAMRGQWRPSPAAYRLAAGIAGALTLALAIPAVTLWSTWRTSVERETVAEQRLEATWERIASLPPDDPDVEATFQAFVADEANQGTRAYHRAWHRRALQSSDPDRRIESWATAWLTADTDHARNESLNGLVTTFIDFDRWEALDALLADAVDEELVAAQLDPQDLRTQVALNARRFDEALSLLTADDPRRAVVEHYHLGTRIDGLHDVLHSRPRDGWICTFTGCRNVDGRSFPGPVDLLLDGGHMGPLFHRIGEGLYRPDGSLLCDVQLPHLIEATLWNGTIAVAASGHRPGVHLVDPETCETTPFPIANGGLDTWVTGLTAIDLDGAPGDELVVGLGPSLGYGLRALSSDGTQVLSEITLGNVRHHVPVQTDEGLAFVVSLSAFHLSRYFFPSGAPTGVAIVPWHPDGFGIPQILTEQGSLTTNAWTVDTADADGDGDPDIVSVHGHEEERLTVWVNDESDLTPMYLGEPSAAFLRQLDDDAAFELVTSIAGETWVMGLGSNPIPARQAPAPMPLDNRPVFARAMRLRRLGLMRRAAEEAERAARTLAFADALDAWTLAGQAWLDAGEPVNAARAFEEAAHMGQDDAGERAMEAYVDGWALAEAREFALRTGLPSRAPRDYEHLDLDRVPPPSVWLAPDVATWSASRGGISVDAINGVGPVVRFEVERRSDLYGVRLAFDCERLEWGARITLALTDTESAAMVDVGLDAHGGDGELYRRISAQRSARSVEDVDPNGVHPVMLKLAYDRQRGARHAEGWMDHERILNDEQAFSMQGDRLIVSIELPPSAQVEGAALRLLLESIELFGLVPTGRTLDPPVLTAAQQRAASLLPIRRSPASLADTPPEDAARAIDAVFRSQMYMHPGDPELIHIATTELGVLAAPEAVAATPFASVLYADALVASGRPQAADDVYRAVIDSPDDHAAALAWAGLADTASVRGEDPTEFIDAALAHAPTDEVGRAWLRRRRLGPLIDGD